MNLSESNAVFTLLAYLCPTSLPDDPSTEEDAARAAILLADAAHSVISEGPSGAQIGRAWTKHSHGPRKGELSGMVT